MGGVRDLRRKGGGDRLRGLLALALVDGIYESMSSLLSSLRKVSLLSDDQESATGRSRFEGR